MFISNQTAKFTSKITGGWIAFYTIKTDAGNTHYKAEGLPTPRHKKTRLIGFFDTEEQRNKASENWLRKWERKEELRKEFNQEMKERREKAVETPTFVVGDIVYNSWGYEQTNIDWYKIVNRTKCYVDLQPIGSKIVEDTAWMAGKVVPNPEHEYGEVERHKIHVWDGKEQSIHFKHGAGPKWDGKPKYYSAYH